MKAILILIAINAIILDYAFGEQAYGPYNQNYNSNMQYGSTNWYSSPLGAGAAQIGVIFAGGLVDMMNRPSVNYVPVPSSPFNAQPSSGSVMYFNNGNCQAETLYDMTGAARVVNVCR